MILMPDPRVNQFEKLPCGCFAEWRDGSGVVAEGLVIAASAFLCGRGHSQGDFVAEAPPGVPKFVWLIERGLTESQSPTVWLDCTKRPTYGGWTDDANRATKFHTKEEAEAYVYENTVPTCRVVEHGFLPFDALAGQEGKPE